MAFSRRAPLLAATLGLFTLGACQVATTETAAVKPPAAAPAPATKRSGSEFLSGPVATATGQWDNGRNGMVLAAMAKNQGGMTAVCGVKAIIGSDNRGLNASVLKGYRFFIGDTPISRGAVHFANAGSPDEIGTTPISCRSTSIPWSDSFAIGPWALRYQGTRTF